MRALCLQPRMRLADYLHRWDNQLDQQKTKNQPQQTTKIKWLKKKTTAKGADYFELCGKSLVANYACGDITRKPKAKNKKQTQETNHAHAPWLTRTKTLENKN